MNRKLFVILSIVFSCPIQICGYDNIKDCYIDIKNFSFDSFGDITLSRPDRGFISTLLEKNIPFNIEFLPMNPNQNVSYNPKTKVTVVKPVNRETNLLPFKTDKGYCTVLEFLSHYIDQMDQYRIDKDRGILSILPQKNKSIMEIAYVNPVYNKTSDMHFVMSILAGNKITFSMGNMHKIEADFLESKFTLDFKGGTLKEFMNSVCLALDSTSPDYIHRWIIDSTEDENKRILLRMMSIKIQPVHTFERLFSEAMEKQKK